MTQIAEEKLTYMSNFSRIEKQIGPGAPAWLDRLRGEPAQVVRAVDGGEPPDAAQLASFLRRLHTSAWLALGLVAAAAVAGWLMITGKISPL